MAEIADLDRNKPELSEYNLKAGGQTEGCPEGG